MSNPYKPNLLSQGFNLIEMAIVLVILSIVLVVGIFPMQEKIKVRNYQRAEQQIDEISKSLYGFFALHKRLPCPNVATSDGLESINSNGKQCISRHGFIPATTLGLNGTRNADGLLLDPWNNPIHYTLSDKDSNNNGYWDWITPNDLNAITPLGNLQGNITICISSNCSLSSQKLFDKAVFILISTGAKTEPNSLNESANTNEQTLIYPNRSYTTASDLKFSKPNTHIQQSQTHFDDIVYWASTNRLYYLLKGY